MTPPRVVALSGGVGGARFVRGLAGVLPPESLTVVVNTADDFEHFGLWISPDIDTVIYTLSGLGPFDRGWGLLGDTFTTLDTVKKLGGSTWFQLGDRDLAMHLTRTELLRQGATLSAVTEQLKRAIGVGPAIVPMADAPVATRIHTEDGRELAFQDWLVRERGAPRVSRISWEGTTEPSEGALRALESADVVLIGPSNPYVSVDPILRLRGVRDALSRTPVFAVSPIVHGKAVKGPLAEMIPSLTGHPPSSQRIADHYGDLLAGLVVEEGDADGLSVRALATRTVMRSPADAERLARDVLAFAEERV